MTCKVGSFDCASPQPEFLVTEPSKTKNSSLTEKTAEISNRICGGIHRRWGEGLLTEAESHQKMQNNLHKAYLEHVEELLPKDLEKDWNHVNPYLDPRELKHPLPIAISKFRPKEEIDEKSSPELVLQSLDSTSFTKDVPRKMTLDAGQADVRGKRPFMEDAFFGMPFSDGGVFGIFDGHGPHGLGHAVARFASERLEVLFTQIFEEYEGNVHKTFEKVFSLIQAEVVANKDFNSIASTALICYIDVVQKRIYTATAGDSEAFIFRKNANQDGQLIPLSCVRSWGSKKDEERADIATAGDYKESVAEFWKKEAVPAKYRRITQKLGTLKLENNRYGTNVSRGFGDQIKNIGRPFETVIAKPKITECGIEEEDVFILACDGLFDYAEKDKIIECIKNNINHSPNKISKQLVELALSCQKGHVGDNVTVLTIKVKK